MLLTTLLTIYANLIVLNFVFMVVLHFYHDKNSYYRYAIGIWAGMFLGFMFEGILQQSYESVTHLFGIVWLNVYSIFLFKLVSKIYNLDFKLKKFVILSALLWFTAILLHFFFNSSFFITSFLICLGINAPVLFIIYQVVRRKLASSIVDKLFVSMMLFEAIHVFDYPILRPRPDMAAVGFSIALVITYSAALLIPVVINLRMARDMNMTLRLRIEQKEEELKQSQERLIHKSNLEALGEMSAGVAHEINTPLAIISMRLGHLKRLLKTQNDNSVQVDESFEIISQTAKRIEEIVGALQTFSNRKGEIEKRAITVEELIQSTVVFCSEKFRVSGIKLDIEIKVADRLLLVRKSEICEAILNLLNNAYDAVLDVGAKWVKIVVNETDKDVVISVIDSGSGVDPSIQNKIMQPFFTTKEVGKGSGLGLSSSKGIVTSNGGELNFLAQEKFTTFQIVLPKLKRDVF